jgi:hypothetical protein
VIFLKIFFAWALFFWGVLLLVSEIYFYLKKEPEKPLFQIQLERAARWLLFALTFSGWYWLLFI